MLRARKTSSGEPLAVIAAHGAKRCRPRRSLPTHASGPRIVLVDKQYKNFAEWGGRIAPDFTEGGVMLPANPLQQHLLLQALNYPRW